MNRLDAITEAYLRATGKATPPAAGTAKRTKLAALAVLCYRQWQKEPLVDGEWDSLYAVVSAGTVTATDTFTLSQAINKISTKGQRELNYVRVLHSDGINYTDFLSVTPAQLYARRAGRVVTRKGTTQIQFGTAFPATDQLIGGTIQVPAITKLADIDDDADEILIDDPNWLPVKMASLYVQTDTQRNYLFDDLNAEANDLLEGMIEAQYTGNESTSTGINYFPVGGLDVGGGSNSGSIW